MTAPVSLEERKAFLFASPRLGERFKIFERLTLASLRNQRSRDFLHVVLYSTELPESWRTELYRLSMEYGFRMEAVAPDTDPNQRAQEVATSLAADAVDRCGRLVTARIDDDDALSRTYVEEVMGLVATPLATVVVARPYGRYLILGKNRRPQFIDAELPFGSQGQALIESVADKPTTIFGIGSHEGVARRLPVILLPTQDAFLVSAHLHNDSARFSRSSIQSARRMEIDAAELFEQFGIDVAGLP